MTVSSDASSIGYDGDGVSTAFGIPFNFFANSDILVALRDSSGNVTILATGFSVSGAGTGSGTCTFTSAPPAGTKVVLARVPDILQPLQYTENDKFPAKTHEQGLDRQTYISQMLFEQTQRALRVPFGDAALGDSSELPSAAARANTFLGFDSAGKPIVATALPSGTLSRSSIGGFINPLTSEEGLATATVTDGAYPAFDFRRYGIPANGVDQTAAIVTLLGKFSAASQRVVFYAAEGTKFTLATVFAAIPVGCKLIDDSQVNWGQPPGYRNKFRVIVSGDSASDDSQEVIAGGHHPALLLLNMGTAGTSSATARFSSLLRGAGIDRFGNPILGFQELHAGSGGKWRMSWVLQTPFDVATKVKPWAVGAAFAANTYCQTSGGKIYKSALGGTAGAGPEPTGTGGPYSDGGVTDWTYVQAGIALSTTRFYFDESGNLFTQGPNDGVTNPTWTGGNGAQSWAISYAPSGQFDLLWRDVSRSKDVFRITDNKGLQTSFIPSPQYTTAANGGATPAITTEGLYLGQSGATNVTGFTLPGTQTDARIEVWFSDGNSTLKNSSTLKLKGAIDVNPAQNAIMRFTKIASISSAWVETYRNF